MPTATTIGGWAVVLGLAGSFYWATNQRKAKNRRPVDTKQQIKSAEPKSKKRRDTGQSSGDQSSKQAKQKKKVDTKPVETAKAATTGRSSNDIDGDDVDDKAFAQAMANAKAGKVGAPQSQAAARTKSVKQKRASEKAEPESEHVEAPSSTGGDADDDQSPANSPDFGATKVAEPVTSGSVSDMLEKPADGPSVLKINAPTNPAPAKQSKPKASFEPVETKKQRQNRKKAEEKKVAREADESERRALMERQRRTAREAEGRAAKDGSAFMAAQASSKSAWTAPPEVNGGGEKAAPKPVELLDTYEPHGKITTESAEEAVHSKSEEHGSQLVSEYVHLTEDQQLRKAKEESTAWEVVKKTKNRKTKAANKDSNESASDEPEYGLPPPAAEQTKPGKEWVMNLTHVDQKGDVVEREVEAQDDEWEVA